MIQQIDFSYETLTACGRRSEAQDVDYLMSILARQDDLTTIKLIDYALSLVSTKAGLKRMRWYLLQGEPIQRNYAALFFKRLGNEELLARAVALGKIDAIQGFAH